MDQELFVCSTCIVVHVDVHGNNKLGRVRERERERDHITRC